MWQVFKSGLFHYIAYWPVPHHLLLYNQLATALSEAVCFLGKLYTELGYAEELLTLRLNAGGNRGAQAQTRRKGRRRVPLPDSGDRRGDPALRPPTSPAAVKCTPPG